MPNTPPPPPPSRPQNHENIVKETQMQHFVEIFGTDPIRAVKFAMSHKMIARITPGNLASFLLDPKLKLSETQLGEYMCVSNHHLAKGLSGHLQVAKCLGEQYASRFDFKTTSLVNALRSFFGGPFLIPKDVKDVEYLSKLFSKRYYNTNHSFESFEVVFVISFSALMMSISVHGNLGNRRRNNNLTLETFSSRIRAIQSCESIDAQLIKQIYDDVLRVPAHRKASVESSKDSEDSRSRSDRSSSVASHNILRKHSPHLRLSSPGMMNMVDNFLRLGIVDSDLVTKVMQCVDRKLFLDAKNLKLAYNDRRIVVGSVDNGTVLLRPSVYVVFDVTHLKINTRT